MKNNLLENLKGFILGIGLFTLLGQGVVCANNLPSSPDREKGILEKSIESALAEHTEAVMAIPGVVGLSRSLCGIQPCIKVFVTRNTPELTHEIKKYLEGYPVVMIVTETIRPRPDLEIRP